MIKIGFAVFAALLLAIFAATAFGFIPGGPDADEIEEAKEVLADDEAKLVDVRTPDEYANNGLDGATNIPLQQIRRRTEEFGDKDEPVVLYCRSGNRSNQARQMLEDEGYEAVYDLGAHRTARGVVEEVNDNERGNP